MRTAALEKTFSKPYLWVLAARPKTLTTAIVPVMVAASFTHPNLWLLASALLTVLCLQIATNFINDAIDFSKGADTHERLGPLRVTQKGLIPLQTVYKAGLYLFSAAALFSLPLIYYGGVPIALIVALSIVCGYFYTAGSKPLAYLGLGDLFVFIFYGIIAIPAFSYIFSGQLMQEAFLAGFQVGMLATVIIAINNLRDHQGDAQANKCSFAVRFGVTAARLEITMLIALAYLASPLWYMLHHQIHALLPCLTIPIAYSLLKKIWLTPPSKEYNRFFAKASLLLLLFGLFLTLGFLAW